MELKKTYRAIKRHCIALAVVLFYFMNGIAQPMAGSYTINKSISASTTNYTSFQSFFNALGANGVNGNVNVEVVSGSGPYIEQVTVPIISGSSSTSKITLNGNNEILRFSASINNRKHTLKIDGTDYLTIKNLHIEATGDTNAWAVHYTNGAEYNVLDNCVIKVTAFKGDWDGIGIVVSTSNTIALNAGNAAKNLLITSCTITGETNAGPGQGIVINPQPSGNIKSNITVQHCRVEGFYQHGIYLINSRGVTIKNNQILRPKRVDSYNNIYAIRSVNKNQEDTIWGNRIFNCFQSAVGGSLFSRFYGIHVENAEDKILVANNLIYNNNNLGHWHGIYLACSKNVKVNHNTIYVKNTSSSSSATYGFIHGNSTCNTSQGSEFVNNIISIDRAGSGGKYGIYQASGAITINHNNIYVVGTNAHVGWDGSNRTTIASWKTATGLGSPFGINSTSVYPDFMNGTTGNLIPQAIAIDNTGKSSTVSQDIVNVARNSSPDVGAFEFEVNANIKRIETSNTNYCEGDSDNIKLWIVNNSQATIKDFYVGVTHNTSTEFFEKVNDSIPANDSLLFTLSTAIVFNQTGSNVLFSRIKGKPLVGPKSVLVSPRPHGSKITFGSKFYGIFNGGDAIDPDVIVSTDTTEYQIKPPLGFFNSGYGSVWELNAINVTVVGSSKTLNTSDTFSRGANTSKNASFTIIPSPNLIGETLKVNFIIKNIITGCISSTTERYISVVEKPNTVFSANNACEGGLVSFFNQSSGGGLLTYKWFFGDGDSSNLINPLKIYNKGGNYIVKLFAYTADGFMDSASSVVTIYKAPQVGFIFKNQCEGIPISFNDTSKVYNGLANVTWDFGDNKGVSSASATSYQYSTDGFYNVKLVVSDSMGCSRSISKNVTFSKKPDAKFSVPPLSCNQKDISFTNNTSKNIGVGFTWFFGDGDSSIAIHTDHTYKTEGIYTVALVAKNSFNCTDTAFKTITLLGTPESDFMPSTTCAHQTVIFQNTTKEPKNTEVTYLWTINTTSTSTDLSPAFTFSSIGTVEVELKATAKNGCEDIIKRTINFTEKPIADFVIPQNVCTGIGYEATNNSVISNGALNYNWQLGSKTSTIKSPKDTFNIEGNYTIRLIALSSQGCSDTATKTIRVIKIPDSDFLVESRKTGDGYMVFTPVEPNGQGAYSWVYSFGGGSNTKTRNEVKMPTSGIHTITLQIINQGCASSTSKRVEVDLVTVNEINGNATLSAYPNPTSGSLTIDLPYNEEVKKVKVFSSEGKKLFEQNFTAWGGNINLSQFASGFYSVVIESEENTYLVKVQLINH